MGLASDNPFPGIIVRESANDGSDFSNPAADYRRLFLGEDGALHLKDSAGAVTDIGGAGGDVATDAIWDAAGDLAVGSGANTAARLAIGAAGGALSVYNGAVIWNSGTSFPATPDTGDRYWRTDLGMEFYFDGTRWLSTTLYHTSMSLDAIPGAVTSDTVLGSASGFGGAFDVWCEDALYNFYPETPNDGTNHWLLNVVKTLADGTTATIAQQSTAASTDNVWNQSVVAIDALAGSTLIRFYLNADEQATAGGIRAYAVVTYRRVAT